MPQPDFTAFEGERLAQLRASGLLDSDPEVPFDRITQLAASIFGTPISLISLVEDNRQWFKSRVGLDVSETARCVSFCAHAIQIPDVFVVPDALLDLRFSNNPLVTGAPNIRFYAGAPLRTKEGLALGTLCVIDTKPRVDFDARACAILSDLAAIVMREIEMGRELEDGKAAKLALFESEQRFRGSMEHAAIGMALVSLDGTFLEVNLALANFLGYEREALMQRTFQDVTYPDDLALDLHECERLLAGEIDEYRLEKRYITSDNRVVWGMLAVTLVRSADGKPLHFVSQTENVTEVHRLADELRKDKEVLLASARELQKAHDDAEAANLAKSEFLAIMSHELRSPLTGVLGFAQLLQMPAFGELNTKQREYVEHIISCGQLELDLLNDILELSNVEAGRVGLEMKAVDPVMVLRSALSNASHAANARGVLLQQDTSTLVSPPVLADPVRLAQVLNNLLSNAIKYNREGGSVAPHLTADDAGVTITITDNGPGIETDRQLELFEPFARLGAENTHVEGHGIGLALCRKLMELMDGDIGVRSIQGEGSSFWIRLNLAPAPPMRTAAPSAELDTSQRLCLLHVEDNYAIRELIKNFVEMHPGIELLQAENGTTGIELAKQRIPGMILLDMNLPDMNGLKFIELLRDLPPLRSVPVTIASASTAREQIELAKAAGVNSFLPKPLNLQHLSEAFTAATQRECHRAA